jgi:hypothetical protein
MWIYELYNCLPHGLDTEMGLEDEDEIDAMVNQVGGFNSLIPCSLQMN